MYKLPGSNGLTECSRLASKSIFIFFSSKGTKCFFRRFFKNQISLLKSAPNSFFLSPKTLKEKKCGGFVASVFGDGATANVSGNLRCFVFTLDLARNRELICSCHFCANGFVAVTPSVSWRKAATSRQRADQRTAAWLLCVTFHPNSPKLGS